MTYTEVDMSSLHRTTTVVVTNWFTKYIFLKRRCVTRRLSGKKQEPLTKRYSGGVHAAHLFSFSCVALFVFVFSNLCLVPNGASGLSILGCPFGLLERLFKDYRLIRIATGSVQISNFLHNSGGNLSRLDPDIHSLYK